MSGIKKQGIVAEGIEFESLDQARKYFDVESQFLDESFEKHWPKFFSKFAKWQNIKLKQGKTNILDRILTFIMAKASRLTISRNRNFDMLGGKGFRVGHQRVFTRSVIVKILKGKKEVALKEINLTIL